MFVTKPASLQFQIRIFDRFYGFYKRVFSFKIGLPILANPHSPSLGKIETYNLKGSSQAVFQKVELNC